MRRVTKPTGRRPGSQPTRQGIVDAARGIFAARGFRGATVRAIAKAADVDAAMISHYFGTKEALFAAAMEFPEDTPARLLAALAGDQAGLGERLTRAYLQLWEDEQTRAQMMIATRATLTSDEARAKARPQIVEMLRQAEATAVPGPDPHKRFALAMAHLLGVASVRHLSQIPPIRDMPLDELVDRTAPAVQLHLTGP